MDLMVVPSHSFFDTIFVIFFFSSEKTIYLSMHHYTVNTLNVTSWVNMDNLLYYKDSVYVMEFFGE